MMEDKGEARQLLLFLRRTVGFGLGLFIVAGIASLALHLNFGILLFGVGMAAAGIGSFFGGPPPYIPEEPQMPKAGLPDYNSWNVPARILYTIKNSTPPLSGENALLAAGLIAMFVAIPFLYWLVYAS